ncbi:MAG TPA: hypothetical protein VIY29_00975, partial [Ktedonobacteraceae bacterium]
REAVDEVMGNAVAAGGGVVKEAAVAPRCTFSRTHVLYEKVSRTREQKRRSFANPSVLYCSCVQPGAETRRA